MHCFPSLCQRGVLRFAQAAAQAARRQQGALGGGAVPPLQVKGRSCAGLREGHLAAVAGPGADDHQVEGVPQLLAVVPVHAQPHLACLLAHASLNSTQQNATNGAGPDILFVCARVSAHRLILSQLLLRLLGW